MQQTNFYRKVERKQFAHSVKYLSPENEYWNTFKSSHNDESHLTVPFLRFCSEEPYDCVTCSAQEVCASYLTSYFVHVGSFDYPCTKDF